MRKLLLLLPFVLVLSTCKKDDSKPAQPDVYICGMSGIGGNYFVTKYWKNGVETVLDDRTSPSSFARAMAVSGSDVYLAGYEVQNFRVIAKYWKNKVANALTDETSWGRATSIAVNGSDVYVAGLESNGTFDVAKYWKNGVAVPLTYGTSEAYANSILISGKDVYVAGFEGNVAKYWKNGVPTQLTSGNYMATAVSIAVSGADVYVLGYENTATGKDAKYWKNGTPNYIGDGATTILGQIAVASNDVYFCGRTVKTALYWKNGVAVPLTDGVNVAQANDITLHNGDVYVVGFEDDGAGRRVAKLWRNGAATNFADEGDVDDEPSAIVVQ